MTENQWQGRSDPYPGKTDAVRGETANVAGQAAGSARNVAETAREQAVGVAVEAKNSTRGLVNQAKSDLVSQAASRQQKAADGLQGISSQLHSMADAPEQQGVASDLVRQAAERSASIATWLENRDPAALLEEARGFARRRPGAFLLLAAGAGLVAGRLGRSLQAGVPTPASSRADQTPSVVSAGPRSTQPPVTAAPRHLETVIAAGTGDHFFEAPTNRGNSG